MRSTHPAPCSAGVTQKYLIVTANYPARSFGVSKLMGIKDAQQRCPDLVLISGEDLTPYRCFSCGTKTFEPCKLPTATDKKLCMHFQTSQQAGAGGAPAIRRGREAWHG